MKVGFWLLEEMHHIEAKIYLIWHLMMHLVAVTHVKLVKCGSWVWFVIEPRLPVICKIELKLLKYGNLFSTDALPNGFDWICLELSQSKTNVTKLSQKILSTNKTTAWHWLRLSHCLVTTSFAMKTYMFIIGYVTNTNGSNITSLYPIYVPQLIIQFIGIK